MPIEDESDQTNLIKGDSWSGKFKKKYVIVTGIIVVLVFIVLISVIVRLSTSSKSDSNEVVNTTIKVTTPPHEQETTEHTTKADVNHHFQVISRRTWLAQPPTEELTKLHLPVPYVFIGHTATNQCTHQVDCILAVRHIQSFHIENNKWSDIGYNFLIGGDGFAYEGRGWKFQGAHTHGYNPKSIGIAFIGTYDTVLPTQDQMTAFKQLIEQGMENGSIAKDYKLLATRQVTNTKSPGLMLYEEIETWPHWSPTA